MSHGDEAVYLSAGSESPGFSHNNSRILLRAMQKIRSWKDTRFVPPTFDSCFCFTSLLIKQLTLPSGFIIES